MSLINVNAMEPSTGTDITLGASGDTITIPSGATFTQSGTMNASAITAGTVATARLGTGTASSTTILYGDQTYKTEPTGGVNTPGFAATNNSAQSISDNTQTIIQFNTEIFDSDSTYDTSAYRFTPAVAGKYYWYIDVSGYSNSDDGIEKFHLRLLKNGSAVYQSYVDYGGTADAIREPQQNIVGVVDLDADDYIEAAILVVFESASSFNLQGGTTYNRFGAFKIIGA